MKYGSEYHWRSAARWNGIPFSAFVDLDGEEQSKLIAMYETANQIDAVVMYDRDRHPRKKQRNQ